MTTAVGHESPRAALVSQTGDKPSEWPAQPIPHHQNGEVRLTLVVLTGGDGNFPESPQTFAFYHKIVCGMLTEPTDAGLSSEALEAALPTCPGACGSSRFRSPLEQPSEGSVTVPWSQGFVLALKYSSELAEPRGRRRGRLRGCPWRLHSCWGSGIPAWLTWGCVQSPACFCGTVFFLQL